MTAQSEYLARPALGTRAESLTHSILWQPEQLPLSNEFDEIFTYARAQGYTTLESLLETNLQLCEQYGLAFYYAEASGLLQEIYRP